MLELFKAPLDSSSLRFSFKFLLAPTGITTTGSCNVKPLLLGVFSKLSGDESERLCVRSNKDKSRARSFPGSCLTVKQWQFSENEHLGASILQWLLLFTGTVIARLMVFKGTTGLRRWAG